MPSLERKAGSQLDELLQRYSELVEQIADAMPSGETRDGRELVGRLVSELTLAVADRDRRRARQQRQAEGIAAAKARGVRFGRARAPLPDNFDDTRRTWRAGQLTLNQAAELCGMEKSSFARAARRAEMEEAAANQREGGRTDGEKTERTPGGGRDGRSVRHHQGPPLPHAPADGAV